MNCSGKKKESNFKTHYSKKRLSIYIYIFVPFYYLITPEVIFKSLPFFVMLQRIVLPKKEYTSFASTFFCTRQNV